MNYLSLFGMGAAYIICSTVMYSEEHAPKIITAPLIRVEDINENFKNLADSVNRLRLDNDALAKHLNTLERQNQSLVEQLQKFDGRGVLNAHVSTVKINFGTRQSSESSHEIWIKGPVGEEDKGDGKLTMDGFGTEIVGAFLVPFGDIDNFNAHVISISSSFESGDGKTTFGKVTFSVFGRRTRNQEVILKCHAVVLFRGVPRPATI